MKKNKENMCAEAIDELCDKYKNRGIAKKAQIDEKASRRRLERARAKGLVAEPSAKSKKYKTGKHEGKSITTSTDFANYYNDLRASHLPPSKRRDPEEYKRALEEAQKPEKLQSKKEARLAIMKLLREKLRQWGIIPPNYKRFIEEVNKGFDEDSPENRGEAKRRRLPKGVLSTVCLIGLSLLLIVTSSVMVSRAKSEVAHLEDRLEELEDLETKLNADLEVKNNMIDIKAIAEGEYGMVSAEYVSSKYLYIEREDKIELGNSHADKSALIRLLEALGLAE